MFDLEFPSSLEKIYFTQNLLSFKELFEKSISQRYAESRAFRTGTSFPLQGKIDRVDYRYNEPTVIDICFRGFYKIANLNPV